MSCLECNQFKTSKPLYCQRCGTWVGSNAQCPCNEPDPKHCSGCGKTLPLKDFVISTLSLANIPERYLNVIAKKIPEYVTAFTAKSYNAKKNYEILEYLGDSTINKFLDYYFYRRYPELSNSNGLAILARLKIKYASKKTFARIAKNLGFWPHILASTIHKSPESELSLLEDVLESFIGVTELVIDDEFGIGVGYYVVYTFLATMFDEIKITLNYENLYDAKTRLKEIFDAFPELGKTVYEDSAGYTSTVYSETNEGRIKLGSGRDKIKNERQEKAAEQAIVALKERGYSLDRVL